MKLSNYKLLTILVICLVVCNSIALANMTEEFPKFWWMGLIGGFIICATYAYVIYNLFYSISEHCIEDFQKKPYYIVSEGFITDDGFVGSDSDVFYNFEEAFQYIEDAIRPNAPAQANITIDKENENLYGNWDNYEFHLIRVNKA